MAAALGGEAWGPGNVLPRVGNFSPPCAKTDRALVCAATFGAQTIQFDCALFDYPRVRAHTTAAFTTTRREVIGTRIHEQSVNDRPTSSPRTKVPTYFHSYDDWQPAALRKRVTLKLKLVCTSAKMRAQATRIKSTDDRGPEWSPALSTRHPLLGQQVSPRTTVPGEPASVSMGSYVAMGTRPSPRARLIDQNTGLPRRPRRLRRVCIRFPTGGERQQVVSAAVSQNRFTGPSTLLYGRPPGVRTSIRRHRHTRASASGRRRHAAPRRPGHWRGTRPRTTRDA